MFYELLAMIRTLGIPTWFLTLSAADMKWPEVIQSIAKQYGTIYTEQEVLELPWRLKSMWLRSNPVTPAQMFQYRLDAFVITFLKSSAQPIGEVIEYVIRRVPSKGKSSCTYINLDKGCSKTWICR